MKYCEKCGTQLNDEAKFCPKCGNPTGSTQADEANSENSSNYCIELISTGPESLQVVKAIKDTLNLSLKEAKDYVDSVPCIMQDGLSLSKAKELAQIIEMSGAKINVKQGYKPIQKDAPSHNEVENNAQEEQSMSKFKKYGLYVLGFLAFFYIVNQCGGESSDSAEEKTEQKQGASAEKQEVKEEAPKKESNPLANFVGKYNLYDKRGYTGSDILVSDDGRIFYRDGINNDSDDYVCCGKITPKSEKVFTIMFEKDFYCTRVGLNTVTSYKGDNPFAEYRSFKAWKTFVFDFSDMKMYPKDDYDNRDYTKPEYFYFKFTKK